MKENDESIYGVSVILSADKILSFFGTEKEIADKLKFIKNSIWDLKSNEEDEYYKLPVIMTEQDDVSVPTVFYLRDYKDNIHER